MINCCSPTYIKWAWSSFPFRILSHSVSKLNFNDNWSLNKFFCGVNFEHIFGNVRSSGSIISLIERSLVIIVFSVIDLPCPDLSRCIRFFTLSGILLYIQPWQAVCLFVICSPVWLQCISGWFIFYKLVAMHSDPVQVKLKET